MIEHALNYAQQGLRVLPLHTIENGQCSCRSSKCSAPGKHPRTMRGVHDASADARQIENWWRNWPGANIGIATGEASGFFAVDFDAKDGGLQTAEDLADRIKCDPLVQKTGGGGLHWLFKYPQGRVIGNRVRALPGVDVRGNGGYIQVAPSGHISGAHYEWLDCADVVPDFSQLINAPEALIDLIASREALQDLPQIEGSGSIVTAHEKTKVQSALAQIRAISPAWLQVGMALHDLFGGSREGFDIWQAWSENEPAYSGADQREHWQRWRSFKPRANGTTVATIYAAAKQAGWIYVDPDDAGIVFDVPGVAQDAQQNDFAIIDDCFQLGRQFVPRPREPLERLTLDYLESDQGQEASAVDSFWRDWLLFRGATVLLAGPPKVGKSRFVQALLTAAATGGSFLGHSFDRPLKTLWIQAEIHTGAIKERIDPVVQMLAAGDGHENGARAVGLFRKNFEFTGRLRLNITQDEHFIWLADLVDRARPDLICIDPLANFHAENENDNGAISAIMRRLETLRDMGSGAALILVHHASKGGQLKLAQGADPFDLIRGAGALRGAYDTGIVLVKDAAQQVLAYWEARNCRSPDPHMVNFDGWQVAQETTEITIDSKGRAVGVAGLDDDNSNESDTKASAGLGLHKQWSKPHKRLLAALHAYRELPIGDLLPHSGLSPNPARARFVELQRAGMVDRIEVARSLVQVKLSPVGEAWIASKEGGEAVRDFAKK